MLKKISLINKKGAIELSVGTMVILVLGMAMLILGIVLVKNILSGATEASELINDNVKAQINKLFNEEDRKSVVYLADNNGNVKKGKMYNVRFGIKNTARGESQAGQFTYTTRASEVGSGCQLTLAQADTYISLGKTGGPISILAGEAPTESIIKMQIPDSAPLCSIRYDIEIKKDSQVYTTNFFMINIDG